MGNGVLLSPIHVTQKKCGVAELEGWNIGNPPSLGFLELAGTTFLLFNWHMFFLGECGKKHGKAPAHPGSQVYDEKHTRTGKLFHLQPKKGRGLGSMMFSCEPVVHFQGCATLTLGSTSDPGCEGRTQKSHIFNHQNKNNEGNTRYCRVTKPWAPTSTWWVGVHLVGILGYTKLQCCQRSCLRNWTSYVL